MSFYRQIISCRQSRRSGPNTGDLVSACRGTFRLPRLCLVPIDLRKEPFTLWIDDLSAPDKIGTIAGFPIHILPIVMAATMFYQQRLTPMDPRQAAIGYIMPVMMLVFFYTLPSGLVFYWTVNNILQVGQQLLMNRQKAQQPKAA